MFYSYSVCRENCVCLSVGSLARRRPLTKYFNEIMIGTSRLFTRYSNIVMIDASCFVLQALYNIFMSRVMSITSIISA